MKDRCAIFLISVLLSLVGAACGDDPDPVMEFYDMNGKIFLENGKMYDATTNFTDEQLNTALVSTKWMRDYDFYYDKKKAGARGESSIVGSWYYVFNEDGSALLCSATSSETYHYSYRLNGHDVTLTHSSGTFVFKVVALDRSRMVVDTPVDTRFIPADYDPETTKQRIVFKSYIIK